MVSRVERTALIAATVLMLHHAARPPEAFARNPTPYHPQMIERHLVTIGGGRRLNLVCIGEGSPTVVFMQGGEGNVLNWRMIEKPIAAMTQACFYDRAGFGYSDPPAGPVTAVSETDDLHALLRKVGIARPVVLVGHSIGGFYATMYADRFLGEVAGLVLVDSGFAGQMHERTPEQRKIAMENSHRGEERELGCAALAKQGKVSMNTPECIRFPPPGSPAEAAYVSYMTTHPYWYEAEVSQSRNFFWGADGGSSLDTLQERAVRRSFGDIPIIAMSSDQMGREAWQDDASFQDFVQHWRAGQAQLAARSTRGKSFVVPGSDHFIQRTRPDVVISAIQGVIGDVRHSPLDPPADRP